jgi:hypothetical protein
MLLDAELHGLRAVPHRAEVRVHSAHHLLRAVAELAAHGVETHRRATVERLQPGGRVHRYLIQNSSDTSWVTAEVVARYSAGPERNLGDQDIVRASG